MASNLEAAKRVEATTFGDRLAEAVERKRSQLVVGLDPQRDLLPVELAGEAHRARGAPADACDRFCRGIDRRGRAVRGGRQAAARVLRGAGRRRHARVRGGVRLRATRPACSSSPTASAATSAPRRARTRPPTSSGVAAASRRRADRQPVPRPRLPRAAARRLPPPRGRHLLPRQDVERRRARSRIWRSPTAFRSGSTWRGSSRSGARTSSASAGSRASAPSSGATHPRAVGEARRLLPQAILLLPGRRRPGRWPGRRRARVHERAGERARRGIALGHLRLPVGGRDDWRSAAAAEAARLKSEVWAASGW